jgi:hypothetical protein
MRKLEPIVSKRVWLLHTTSDADAEAMLPNRLKLFGK